MKQQETAKAILRAARKSFARHGYEGASIRQITAAAGVNLGAVTYHFGSKRKLYEHVLDSAASPLADAATAAATSGQSPKQQVGAVIRAYFNYLGDNIDLAQLMLQELAMARVPPEAALDPIRRIHRTLTELVQRGQSEGVFREGDPRLMAISIISQPVHMSLVRRALKAIGNIDLQDEHTREHVIEQVTAFAVRGLAKDENVT